MEVSSAPWKVNLVASGNISLGTLSSALTGVNTIDLRAANRQTLVFQQRDIEAINTDMKLRIRMGADDVLQTSSAWRVGAGRVEGGHQHPFVRTQNLGGLAHEFHARDDQGACWMSFPKPRHLERIGNTPARLFCQGLNHFIGVIVGNNDCIFALEPRFESSDQGFIGRASGHPLRGIQMRTNVLTGEGHGIFRRLEEAWVYK